MRVRRRLAPSVRLALAALLAIGGAYLISLWMVGLVLISEAALYVLVIWDDGKPVAGPQREQVLERWRQAR